MRLRIHGFVCRILAVAALGLVGLAPALVAAQGLNTMRPSTRAVERAVSKQVQARLVPRLDVRNSTGPARELAVDPAAEVLAVVDGAGDLRLFDLGTGQQVALRAAPGAPFAAVALGAGGRPVAVRDRSGQVFLAPHPGAALQPIAANAGAVRALAADLDGGRLALGHIDGGVSIWDVAAGRVVQELGGDGPAVTALAAYDSGFVLGDAAGGLRRLDRGGRLRAGVDGTDSAVRSLAVAPDGRIAVGHADGHVSVRAADLRAMPHAGRRFDDTAARGLAWLPDGGLAAGSAAGGLHLWRADGEGGMRTLRGGGKADAGAASGVAAIVSGGAVRILATGAANGVSVFDPAEANPLVRLILVEGAWGAVDMDGRFDGSEPAFRDIRWRAKDTPLGLDRFAGRYFEPGLLAKHLNPGLPLLTADAAAIGDGIYLPPQVTLDVTAPQQRADARATLRVRAEARAPASVAELLVFHNGKRVPADRVTDRARGDDRGLRHLTVTLRVPLTAGENRFRAVAVGWGRLWSEPARAALTARAAAPPEASLRLNAVGVNRYSNPRLNLNYAVADARGVAEVLTERAGPLFARVDRNLLLDGEASRDAVLGRLDALRDSGKRDAAVVFLSGHGRTVGEDWYYLPHDLEYLRDDAHVRDVGISGGELTERLIATPAQRILVIIDTCQAGAFIGDLNTFGQRRALRELRERTGVFVIAATRADQLAPEYRRLGHGLLTYVLLRGMQPGDDGRLNADRNPADGELTVAELQTYVEDEVPLMAHELDAQLRSPVGSGADFTDRSPVTPVGLALGEAFALARR